MNEIGQKQAAALCSALLPHRVVAPAAAAASAAAAAKGSSTSLFGVEGSLCFGKTLFGTELCLERNTLFCVTGCILCEYTLKGLEKVLQGNFLEITSL